MRDTGPIHGDDQRREPRVFGIVVTYRRPQQLAWTIDVIMRQTLVLEQLVIIDNGPGAEARDVVARAANGSFHYLPTGENLGPAGALCVGTDHVLRHAADRDWLLFLDDDNPPAEDETLARLLAFAEERATTDPRTAAVGVTGARYDPQRGRLMRPSAEELDGAVPIDFIGGGQLPMYKAGALRQVGPPRSDLFFGFDDLELGLRLRTSGFSVYADGAEMRSLRERYGRNSVSRRSTALEPASWRDYYSLRNLIVISRLGGHRRAALRITARAGLARAAVQVARRPSAARLVLSTHGRGCLDGWMMRLGRRLEPTWTE